MPRPASAVSASLLASADSVWLGALAELSFFSSFFVIQQHRFYAPHYLHFLSIQLIHEALSPQIEGPARLLVWFGALPAVVKAPAGGPAAQRSAQIRQEVRGHRFP
jgi:hypothetical protein